MRRYPTIAGAVLPQLNRSLILDSCAYASLSIVVVPWTLLELEFFISETWPEIRLSPVCLAWVRLQTSSKSNGQANSASCDRGWQFDLAGSAPNLLLTSRSCAFAADMSALQALMDDPQIRMFLVPPSSFWLPRFSRRRFVPFS